MSASRAERSEYMRGYRAKLGGSTPSDKARREARDAAAKWVYDNHPEVFTNLLAVARQRRGLPIDVGPGGTFTKPIDHGTVGGYRAHQYRDERPCTACRLARSQYDRDRAATPIPSL